MTYQKFDDWFWELENYSTRGDRFYEEFAHLSEADQKRMFEWLSAAWDCARSKGVDNVDA